MQLIGVHLDQGVHQMTSTNGTTLPDRKVGVRVTTSGYLGTITRVCEWADGMVEVRLQSGTVCVDIHDCRVA